MAIPSNPTVTAIVTEGLKRGGRVTPSATQISDATEHQFREVKSDIMRVASTHPYLQVNATTSTVKGEQRYALPDNANMPVSVVLLNGPDNYRGVVQAGTASSVTLDSDFPAGDDEIIGHYVLLTAGTGAGQYRQIRDYVASTKVATISPDWTITPDVTSEFLVVNDTRYLWPWDTASELDKEWFSLQLGTPHRASQFSDEFLLYPVPDRVYGLLFRYYVDLDRLDDATALFLNLLREWRSIWIQGVAVKTMQRYDEDRYQTELGVYQIMLDQLANQTATVSALQYRDL